MWHRSRKESGGKGHKGAEEGVGVWEENQLGHTRFESAIMGLERFLSG